MASDIPLTTTEESMLAVLARSRKGDGEIDLADQPLPVPRHRAGAALRSLERHGLLRCTWESTDLPTRVRLTELGASLVGVGSPTHGPISVHIGPIQNNYGSPNPTQTVVAGDSSETVLLLSEVLTLLLSDPRRAQVPVLEFNSLIDEMRATLAATEAPPTKSKLRSLVDTAMRMGEGVFTNLLAAIITAKYPWYWTSDS